MLIRRALQPALISFRPRTTALAKVMSDFIPKPVFSDGRQVSSASTSGSAKMFSAVNSHNQYITDGIDRNDLDGSPIRQFDKWFKEVSTSPASGDGKPPVAEPEAMVLGTTTLGERGGPPRPSSRVVLLKRVDDHGFVFFSNYESRKGAELAANPWASLTFYWREVHRSVRVLGRAERLTADESKAYFDSRPVGSRIGAWASPQSQVIPDRSALESRVRGVEERFGVPGAAGLDGKWEEQPADVPLPDFWGGFRIVPDEIEFWVGRENRLHDRFRCVSFLPLAQCLGSNQALYASRLKTS